MAFHTNYKRKIVGGKTEREAIEGKETKQQQQEKNQIK